MSSADKVKLDSSGTISAIVPGQGLVGGGASGSINLAVTIDALTAKSPPFSDSWEIMLYDGANLVKVTFGQLKAFFGGGTPVVPHIKYAAVRPDDANFVAADFTDETRGSSTNTNIIVMPTFTTNVYVAYAIPSDQPDLTVWKQVGSPFNQIDGLFKQDDQITIAGDPHNIYIFGSDKDTHVVMFANTSETSWEIS